MDVWGVGEEEGGVKKVEGKKGWRRRERGRGGDEGGRRMSKKKLQRGGLDCVS